MALTEIQLILGISLVGFFFFYMLSNSHFKIQEVR